jgi:quercetin dioxygenase-like cupin family protein
MNAILCKLSESGNFTGMKPISIPSNGGRPVNVLGTPMQIRVAGGDTNGTLSVVETVDQPGGGPPPHIHHREDETFQILEGEYEFSIAGQSVSAGPGTTLFAPRGIAHTYRCVGASPGRLLCVITPAGFERFFEEVGALSPAQQSEIPRIVALAAGYGLEFLPPA